MLICEHAHCKTVIGRVPGSVRLTRPLLEGERTEFGYVTCPHRGCRTKWEIRAA